MPPRAGIAPAAPLSGDAGFPQQAAREAQERAVRKQVAAALLRAVRGHTRVLSLGVGHTGPLRHPLLKPCGSLANFKEKQGNPLRGSKGSREIACKCKREAGKSLLNLKGKQGESLLIGVGYTGQGRLPAHGAHRGAHRGIPSLVNT